MALAGSAAVLPVVRPARAQTPTPIIIAEPLHSTGYLPVYIAIHKGYFAAENLAARILTVESGSGHTNAVLSGQAFAFVGGPEHDAFAKAKGGELRCVVNVVDRGNVYLVAKKGVPADGADLAKTLKGKSIAVNFYGGTPNSILRYLAARAKLDPTKDFKMVETTSAGALAAVKGGQADMAVVTEPQITQGIRAGLWGEPFYSVPKELGPYAYSTLNIRADSIQKDPKMVQGFVRAVIKGLQYTYADPGGCSRYRAPGISDNGAGRSQSDSRSVLCRQSLEPRWSGQPRRVGYGQSGRDGGGYPEAGRSVRRNLRHAVCRSSDYGESGTLKTVITHRN